jgi:hypothetical protein
MIRKIFDAAGGQRQPHASGAAELKFASSPGREGWTGFSPAPAGAR